MAYQPVLKSGTKIKGNIRVISWSTADPDFELEPGEAIVLVRDVSIALNPPYELIIYVYKPTEFENAH
jgi:hypothetical protein